VLNSSAELAFDAWNFFDAETDSFQKFGFFQGPMCMLIIKFSLHDKTAYVSFDIAGEVIRKSIRNINIQVLYSYINERIKSNMLIKDVL
jgi:hypothetical protein